MCITVRFYNNGKGLLPLHTATVHSSLPVNKTDHDDCNMEYIMNDWSNDVPIFHKMITRCFHKTRKKYFGSAHIFVSFKKSLIARGHTPHITGIQGCRWSLLSSLNTHTHAQSETHIIISIQQLHITTPFLAFSVLKSSSMHGRWCYSLRQHTIRPQSLCS